MLVILPPLTLLITVLGSPGRVLVIDRVLERADELQGTDPLEMKILREPQVQQHVKHKVEECFILYERPPAGDAVVVQVLKRLADQKRVARVESAVANVPEQVGLKPIGTRLRGGVCLANPSNSARLVMILAVNSWTVSNDCCETESGDPKFPKSVSTPSTYSLVPDARPPGVIHFAPLPTCTTPGMVSGSMMKINPESRAFAVNGAKVGGQLEDLSRRQTFASGRRVHLDHR